jgi:PST family polysaccharide transporter
MSDQIKNKDDYFNTEHLKAGLKGKAMRGAGVTIFASGLSFFVHIFSTVILARLLTPSDFGLIAMVTAFSLLLQNFGVNGFSEAIIQKDVINHKLISTLFWVNAAISASLTIIFMLLAPVIAWFYKSPELSTITVFIAFSIIAAGMTTIHMAILRRNMQFYLASGISIVAMLVSISTAIILAWLGWGYWALVANTVLLPLTTAFCGWIFCRWRPGKPGSIKDIKPILIFAIHTYGNFTLNYFSRNIDKLLVGWRYGAQSLGYYKRAYDLFSLPASQLIVPIHNVALAALSRLTNEPDKYSRYYLNTLSIIAFVGMPLSAILTLAGKDIILLILGSQWTKAGEVFCYFGASIGIMLIQSTQGWLHLSLGRPDRWVRWSILECIILSCCFLISLPFGIEGVAIAYSLSFYFLAAPCLWYAGRPIKLNIISLISSMWRYFAAALVAGLLSFAILYKFNFVVSTFTHLHVFFRIITASFLCLTMYLILIILFYQSLAPIKQFISIASQMLPDRMKQNQ